MKSTKAIVPSSIDTILGIETATNASTLALYHKNTWFTRENLIPKMHSENLLPMLQSLLQEAGIEITELKAIGVGVGPGSFTGLRIAVGLAQALGFGLNIPIWPISTLAALAYTSFEMTKATHNVFMPMLDARMQAVYWGIYKLDEKLGVSSIVPDCLTAPENVGASEVLGKKIIVTGSGIDVYYNRIMPNLQSQVERHIEAIYPDAKAVVSLTQKKIQSNVAPISAHNLTPRYIRNDVAQVAKEK